MIKEELISIIIPFYNAELFLERSVDTVISQTYPSIEIILVNDGSIDNSLEIANRYEELHQNVKLLNTVNKGPGNARNIGIENANGKYIIFLDADDELESEMIYKLYKNLVYHDSDMSICLYSIYDSENKLKEQIKWEEPLFVFDSLKTISLMITQKVIPTVWGKLFKKSIVDTCVFPDLSWREDDVFLMKYLLQSKKISLLPESLLNINCISTSLTRQVISSKKVRDMYDSFSIQLELLKENNQQKLEHSLVNHQISFFFRIFMVIVADWKGQVKNDKELLSLFSEKMNNFSAVCKSYSLGFKKYLFIVFLRLPQWIGWEIPVYFVSILKGKQIKTLR